MHEAQHECNTRIDVRTITSLDVYEIRLKGHLDDRWASRFEGLTITREDNGETLFTGPVVDQAALHGLLRKVRDLGLPLVSVTQVEPKQANGPDVNTDTDHNRSNKETTPMNTSRQTTVIKGSNQERKMKLTTPELIRWAGLSAMVAGIIFAGIQPIHPPDVLASVTTTRMGHHPHP